MDPAVDIEWFGCKNAHIDEVQNIGNVAHSWQWRERGINPPHFTSNKSVLENAAEDILVQKSLKIRCCDLPGYPRSTFLMVFSPDGTKVASTHGNHNIYVSELASGKHVRILRGHPRTPWCIAFHPSHPQLIGSGCLGGQVRVWDISSGGSEVWNVRDETVIASIAFHPRDQLLVIATYNELYFWNWNQAAPFTKVSTSNINEKVRYVAFDSLGYKLITGISLWMSSGSASSSQVQQSSSPTPPTPFRLFVDPDDNNGSNRAQDTPGSPQDTIVNSYQNLVQRYDSLVRNYQRLFMVRHRLTNTPPPPNTIDRGTDPMETDPSPGGVTRSARTSTTNQQYDEGNPGPSTSRQQESADGADSESTSSRLLNLDILSFGSSSSRDQDSSQAEHSIFGSRSSAFQPLNDYIGRSFRPMNQNDRVTRLLPNPFSSTSNTTRSERIPTAESAQSTSNSTNSSRTSVFPSFRSEPSLGTEFLRRPLRNTTASQLSHAIWNELTVSDESSTASSSLPSNTTPSTSGTNTTRRPTMINSSTQMGPASSCVYTQTINESLDLIRDILRDSGTRLLNLITNMSLPTLASVERSMSRRDVGTRAHSDESESAERTHDTRSLIELLSSRLRRELLSLSSESDSDQSLEVNILRTRNSTSRDNESRDNNQPNTADHNNGSQQPTDRMVFELNRDAPNEGTSQEANGFNICSKNSRFRVRTLRNTAGEGPSTSNIDEPGPSQSSSQNSSDFDPNRPSTSRENFWTTGRDIPSDEAYRRVSGGVNALQKHTMQLTNMWIRGNHTTMRELRNMWENLHRRILMLHRETGRQDVPNYYARSLLERCMLLTQMTDNVRDSGRNPSRQRTENSETGNRTENVNVPMNESISNSNTNEQDMQTENNNDAEQSQPGRSAHRRTTPYMRYLRRRLQSSYRWRPEDEQRRRSRNSAVNRLSQRYPNRPRRDFVRAIEICATRNEIRMRAMQVLSVIFNMMMMCLEERGLSQLIINMLRSLKKALELTCLMLMTNRNTTPRNANSPLQQSSRMDALNVVRIENIDHAGPVNVDGLDESPNSVSSGTEDDHMRNKSSESQSLTPQTPTTSQVQPAANTTQRVSPPSSASSSPAQRWSNRLAVQISAANRNNSATAIYRRKLYLERKRQKALHKSNPTAHPLMKKRIFPPVSSHRIPALRSLPRRSNALMTTPPRNEPNNTDSIPGPSSLPPGAENANLETPRNDMSNELERRINLLRLANLHAVRIRNAARFRRLETIRLYTPSSVREMFTLQPNSNDNQQSSRSEPQSGTESDIRRTFASYLPHIFTRRMDVTATRHQDELNHFHAVINNVPIPVMQVNEPATTEPSGNQSQRLPRIHEYLQPIILAQNAMVIDDEANNGGGGGAGGNGGGSDGANPGRNFGPRRMSGMAGLLDAGIISEALPAPSHRVQAWDFTTGSTPDIADSSKNVVVQRCRIHNDASIDISKDGKLLVALLPVHRLRNTNNWLGVYSLEWSRLGQCLHSTMLDQSAVSVALSPTARHLAVGLGLRRFTTTPHARNNVFALLYRLENTSQTGLTLVKELEQNWEHGFTSLNCLRWAPQPGQGLVYANNTGQLIIMS